MLEQSTKKKHKTNKEHEQKQQLNDRTFTELRAKKKLSMLNKAPFKFNRDNVTPGILHFSTGNFHRAHQASYLQDLLNYDGVEDKSHDFCWGLRECSVREGSYTRHTLPELMHQDYLYTLVQMNADRADAEIIGSILDMLPYHKEHKPIREALLCDTTKIVSMTVTEGGYFVNPATGEFDETDKAIQVDVENPEKPQTVFGLIVQALKQRREQGKIPFTVMSCDNVPHNGNAARNATIGLARMVDKELAEWIEENVCFPNSMVDRITPAPTDDLAKAAGVGDWDYEDDAVLFCEPFKQWVCEDSFCNGRPSLEKVGVKFVKDVTPWEDAKLRILNGGHASMSYAAALLGLEYVHQAMEHKGIAAFLDNLQTTEIVPHCPPVPETDLLEYWETIRARYHNPKLADQICRNCENGSDRQPKFILPTIESFFENKMHKKSEDILGLATVSALWCRYCQGRTESGEDYEVIDELAGKLKETALAAKENPKEWLTSLPEVYGEVSNNECFQQAFTQALTTINDKGVEAALKQYCEA